MKNRFFGKKKKILSNPEYVFTFVSKIVVFNTSYSEKFMENNKQIFEFERPIYDLITRLEEMKAITSKNQVDMSGAVEVLEKNILELKNNIYKNLSRWQKVQISRHTDRPYTLNYIEAITTDFTELFGDRQVKDDKAMVGGFARIGDYPVMIIGQQKGRDLKSRQYRNFGMPNPEGYRKALRLMRLAEKFQIPVITLIDTPGAFPGIEAEERGQGEAIAKNLMEMAVLKTPIICIVIGEGASGGALGIGIGDKVYMLEHTWYSVISPESCSSILWRTWEKKELAAEALKLSAQDNLEFGIIDGVIPEPLGGAHYDPEFVFNAVKEQILTDLAVLTKTEIPLLIEQRIDKFSKMGVVEFM